MEAKLQTDHPQLAHLLRKIEAAHFEILNDLQPSTTEQIAALIGRYAYLDQKSNDDISRIEENGKKAGLIIPQLSVMYQQHLVGYAALKAIALPLRTPSPASAYIFEKTTVTDTISSAGQTARSLFKDTTGRSLGAFLSESIIQLNEIFTNTALPTIARITTQLDKKHSSPVLTYPLNQQNKIISVQQFAIQYPNLLNVLYPQYEGEVVTQNSPQREHWMVYNGAATKILANFKVNP